MISVVVPTWNREVYLPECIDSILAQTYKDFELIIVDDGSTDDSKILYNYYTEKDKRVRVLYVEHGGIARARNAGIEASKGEYIAVMDSDDIMSPNRLKMSLRAIEGYDFVYSPYGLANERGEVLQWIQPPSKVTFEDIKRNGAWPHVTIMARRRCFDDNPYRNEFEVNDDSGLVWDWFRADYRSKMIKDPTVIVRTHPKSTSSTEDKRLRNVLDILEKEYDEYEG